MRGQMDKGKNGGTTRERNRQTDRKTGRDRKCGNGHGEQLPV